MKDIEIAKINLKNETTLVLVKSDSVIKSTDRGVAPLINFINDGVDLNGYSLADKVVGKAVAMLLVKVGIKEVYAKVISEPAVNYLKNNNILVNYETLVTNIVNRNGTGMCPMEETVLNEDDYNRGYELILKKLFMLRGN